MSVPERMLPGRVRDLLEHDLLEQSVPERLARAAFAASLLWLAIYSCGQWAAVAVSCTLSFLRSSS